MCACLPRASGDSSDIWTRHSWNGHGTQGHSGMVTVMPEGLEISQLPQTPAAPWLCPAGSATGKPKSSMCIPCTYLSPSFPSGIYLYCGLQRITLPTLPRVMVTATPCPMPWVWEWGHASSQEHRDPRQRSQGLDVIPSNLLWK